MADAPKSSIDGGPNCLPARSAKKFLRDCKGLAKRRGVRQPIERLQILDVKLAAGTIASTDLPATLKNEFPGEFEGMTLHEIEELCP